MKILPLLAAALVLAAPLQAQERTAGQAMDAQVNWSALQNSINLVSTQNQALAAMLDKMTACNAKKMIFAPADAAADANGCVSTSSGIDYTACTSIDWVHSNKDLYCPAGSVVVAGKSRRSDSGEWNGMICCPLGKAAGAPPVEAPPPPSSGGATVIFGGGGGCGGTDNPCGGSTGLGGIPGSGSGSGGGGHGGR